MYIRPKWIAAWMVPAAFMVSTSSSALASDQTAAEFYKRGLDQARQRQFDKAISSKAWAGEQSRQSSLRLYL